ncbi:MAG TPA: FAD-binding oxidoreductase [Arachnia sp.]|nr:FAD-binding oxidoreductase [Arachnia sp.]HMT84908.1 FAD-binding oxidoreductase [Arachnia sp.]
MIEGVTQQKWWGWGEEGKAYHYEDKPKFAPFVLKKIGVDITKATVSVPAFDSLTVPPTTLTDALRAELAGIVGERFVQSDDETRVVHGFGKGVRDLVRVRRGEFGRLPDVVVYPGTEDEVARLVDAVVAADGVIIPFGGGSNIVAALEAVPGETRQVVSVNLARMRAVREIDEQSGLALIEAGVYGPDMETQLNALGWTLGHHPDSFVWSTLGGWIATRSSGMQSDKYGDIADITRGLTMVMPGQVLELRPLPSSSSGPSVREMVLGSEGRLGIITKAWVNVHRIPEVRELQAYFFATYEDGLKACQQIVESDASVMMARVSDPLETQYIMANGKQSSKVSSMASKAIQKIMESKGWDLENICMSFVGFEGSANHVRYEKGLVSKIVKANNGMGVGKGPGLLYDQKKYDTPYIRDFMLDRGIVADVSETSTPWAYAAELHTNVVAAAHQAMQERGVTGVVFCHLSHSYHSGACQYFTFAIKDDSEENLITYDHVKRAIQQAFMDNHATVSHHHGVGEEHSPWMDQDISPAGVFIQRKLFDGVDPGRNLNPGKIIHDGAAGISSNSADA